MSEGRDSRSVEYYEDVHEGVPHATKIFDIDHLSWTTCLGPVPRGRVWRVTDVDFYNYSAANHIVTMRSVYDNGSGYTFYFKSPILIAPSNGSKIPANTYNPFAPTDHFPTKIINLEHDDILQLKIDVNWVINKPNVRISYWEHRA